MDGKKRTICHRIPAIKIPCRPVGILRAYYSNNLFISGKSAGIYLLSILNAMKTFIRTLITFTLVTVAVFSLLLGGSLYTKLGASFELDREKNILILGDSHTEYALDDKILPRCENVSQAAAIYLFSYCKLRKFLESNPQIDTVLLSFWYDPLINKGYDDWHSKGFTTEQTGSHFTLLGWDELILHRSLLLQSLPEMFNISFFVKHVLLRKNVTYKDLDIGKYQASDRYELPKGIERAEEGLKNKTPNEPGDEWNLSQKEYLLKIANLCKQKGVCLILIATPVYRPDKYDNLERLYDYRQKYLPEACFLDYSNFSLPDSCYRDITHLNYRGSEIFSRYLRETLIK
jgi:hypothetical protein